VKDAPRWALSQPRALLHLEGAAVLLLATAAFFRLGHPWWLFLLLILAPDVSLLGLLAGPRVGALVYNAAHTMVGPLALLGGGWWLGGGQSAAVAVALVWLAQIDWLGTGCGIRIRSSEPILVGFSRGAHFGRDGPIYNSAQSTQSADNPFSCTFSLPTTTASTRRGWPPWPTP